MIISDHDALDRLLTLRARGYALDVQMNADVFVRARAWERRIDQWARGATLAEAVGVVWEQVEMREAASA